MKRDESEQIGTPVAKRFPRDAVVSVAAESTMGGRIGRGRPLCEVIEALLDPRINPTRLVLLASFSTLVHTVRDDDDFNDGYVLPALVRKLLTRDFDPIYTIVLAEADWDEWEIAFSDAPRVYKYCPRNKTRQALNRMANPRDKVTIPNSYMLIVNGFIVQESYGGPKSSHDVTALERDIGLHRVATMLADSSCRSRVVKLIDDDLDDLAGRS